MHDILIGFINDWSRKVMASKAFLLVATRIFTEFEPTKSIEELAMDWRLHVSIVCMDQKSILTR